MLRNPTLRLIRNDDNPVIAEIIKNVFEEFDAPKKGTVYSDSNTDKLFSYFQKDGSAAWVVEENNQLLGCCGIYPTKGLKPDTVELVKFYLKPSGRGRGLGKRLLEHASAAAKELGYSVLYIESLAHFSGALHLYRKFGFKEVKQRLRSSGHDSCNIWMTKKL